MLMGLAAYTMGMLYVALTHMRLCVRVCVCGWVPIDSILAQSRL